MKIAVLGTGTVGQVIASKLIEVGHDVMMGSRTADNAKASAWVAAAGPRASQGTFADAAAFAEELVFNCTSGTGTLAAVAAANAGGALDGRILVDLSNPLDFSNGFPPTLSVCNTDSLGEQLQRALPKTRVVKTLNTVANPIMVDPARLGGGDHTMFIAGDDPQARARVATVLTEWFGWRDVLDVGGIGLSRGLEAWLLLWTRLYGVLGHADFNLKVVR